MAIPISGKVSIGDIRTELRNGGKTNFELSKAGRPTTGVPNTGQNPLYTPVNQSSSYIPDNSDPRNITEWRGYSHTENLSCDGEYFLIMVTNTYLGLSESIDIYRYDFNTNTYTLLMANFTGSENLDDDVAITRNKLFHLETGAYASGDKVIEYDIILDPFSISYNRHIQMGGGCFGLFAKNNTTLVFWRTVGGTTYIIEADISANTAVESTLFTIGGTYYVGGELHYDSVNQKYYLPFSTGGLGVAPHYVGRYSTAGSLEVSVPVDEIIDSIFVIGNDIYGVADDRDIYLLNFTSATSSYIKTAPSSGDTGRPVYFDGVAQYKYPDGFTTPSLGKFYTYYRLALRGNVGHQSLIEVVGDSTNDHWCYIYTSYPFDNVGQIITTAAWTYSYFDSSTTKYFTRTMGSPNEVLHFVIFQDGS